MRPSTALDNHRRAIIQIVESHNARNPRVFGSVIHGTDQDGSDLDILIDPTADTSLFPIVAIRRKLKSLLAIEVDVVTLNAVPGSFRRRVLEEAKLI
jgi:predicted nucleotidyltransferase